MRFAWVLGSRGLLGSAFSRALLSEGTTLFTPSESFDWKNSSRLAGQLKEAIVEFSTAAACASRWEVYWAAGVGTMSSSEESLLPETQALQKMLSGIAADLQLMSVDGTIVFASSAGAVYGSCEDEIITEASIPTPTNAYARAKLAQEDMLRNFCALHPRVGVLLARISTLYGAGQSFGKPQGLLTHMARSIVSNKPIGIYVPIDTIRDYISADEAAIEIVEVARENLEIRPDVLTKIIASERPTTIAEIISIFKRVAKKAPRITTSASKASNLYARRVQFRSVVPGKSTRAKARSLVVGIAQLVERERYQQANPDVR